MKLSIRELLFDLWSVSSAGMLLYHFVLLCIHWPHPIFMFEGNRAILGVEVAMMVWWLGLGIDRTIDDIKAKR